MEGTWLEDWFDVEPFTTAALRRVRREPFVGQLQIGAELLDAYAAPVRGGVPGAPEVIGLFVVWSTATSRAAALAEVAESTAVVRTASDEIAERAQEAVAVVGDAVGSAERAAEVLAGLERASKEIGAVMSVIATIAEQTNLLALNATIEAARAGELGRGFAVVASEVKELARNTAHATTDVENRIRAVVDGTVAAAQSVASISDVVRRIDALQHEIADAVAQQRGSTDDLHEVVLRALG
ncbi:methyl-accepting chemotaxis protein [Nocardioides sp. TRM66260-LWL]|nr:methyl-accepting chemotaxis protein [Nocardioides sp. TRM66260-LWL]